MSLSVADFPPEVLEQILLFVPSPRALLRVGTTCVSVAQLVSSSERVWDSNYRARWACNVLQEQQRQQRQGEESSTEEQALFSLQDYKRRHLQDGAVLKNLLQVTQAVDRKQDYGLGREYQSPLWTAMSRNVDSVHVLRAVANRENWIRTWYPCKQTYFSPLCRALAAQLVDLANFRHVLSKLEELIERQRNEDTDARTSMRVSNIMDTGVSSLEDGAILIAQSVWTWQDLLAEPSPVNRIARVQDTLTKLAHTLMQRLDHQQPANSNANVLLQHHHETSKNALQAVTILNEILMEEMGFQGNADNYYDVRNSDIDYVLQSRKGIPLTLAVIYKCILHRVHVDIDIIGLPGHVVLGIPSQDVYVDVFDGGRILSLDDCRAIVQSYVIEWRPQFTRPLDTQHVVMRLLRNVERCQALAVRESRTTTAYSSMVRTIALRTFVQRFDWARGEHFPNLPQDPCAFMNPAIFRHYNVINDDTMRRHTEAPFFQFQRDAENN